MSPILGLLAACSTAMDGKDPAPPRQPDPTALQCGAVSVRQWLAAPDSATEAACREFSDGSRLVALAWGEGSGLCAIERDGRSRLAHVHFHGDELPGEPLAAACAEGCPLDGPFDPLTKDQEFLAFAAKHMESDAFRWCFLPTGPTWLELQVVPEALEVAAGAER